MRWTLANFDGSGGSFGNKSHHSNRQKERSHGFTLIELLVVVSIIALLVAILLPALGRARDQAKAVACRAMQRQYGLAVVYYAQENGGLFPQYASDDCYGSIPNTSPDYPVWDVWNFMLAPYLGLEEIEPTDSDEEKMRKRAAVTEADIRRCPSGKAFVGPVYGANASARVDAPWLIVGPTSGPGFKYDAIRNAAEWILFIDVVDGWGMYSPNFYDFIIDRSGDGIPDSSPAFGPTVNYNYAMPQVHNNGCNIALADGHVEWMSFQQFQEKDYRFWDGRPNLK